MLTGDQKQSFEERGYLVLEGVVGEGLLETMRREAQALMDSEPPEVGRRVWHERALFRRRAFREALDVAALVEAERDLIGEDVQLLALGLRPGVPSYHGDDERYNRRGEAGTDFPSDTKG